MSNDLIFSTPDILDSKNFEIFVFNVDHVNVSLPENFQFIDQASGADVYLFNQGFNYIFDRNVIFENNDLFHERIVNNIKFYRHQRRKKNFLNIIKNSTRLITSDLENEYFDIFQELIQIPYQNKFEFFHAAMKLNPVRNFFNLTLLTFEEASEVGLFEDFLYCDHEFILLLKVKTSEVANEKSTDLAHLYIFAINEILNNNFKNILMTKVDENINKHSATFDSLTFNDLSLLLSKLDFPIAVINHESLVLANDLFLKLGVLPSKLVGKSSKDWIEIDEVFYQIKKSTIIDIGTIYIFTRVEKRKDKLLDHQSDLGIITGSIAHELNNPVAGILAAITLLELDEWEDENKQVLKDLKESASRSKSLIETFLSISRHNKKLTDDKLLCHEIDKALSLLRYRIIESGINLNVEQDKSLSNVTSKLVVIPIVLYLIYGELLTIFSHKRLLDSNLPKNLCLSMNFINSSLVIKLKSFDISKDEEKKFQFKLLEHLMDMDSIKLKITNNTIELLLS